MSTEGSRRVSRRAVLRATGGTVGLPLAGTARADGDEDGDAADDGDAGGNCPEATREPSMEPCPGASEDGCDDDHPRTVELRRAVRESLAERYPTVGSLLRQGYLPYFDLARPGEEGGYSHWLNPAYIGDDGTLDPERPESVLVDNEWWRPIGAMFVATDRGDRIETPPAVYGGDGADEPRCSPWHRHVGLPGRFAWWFYRTVYEDDPVDADLGLSVDGGDGPLSVTKTASLELPCSTACMLHVWTYPNPDGVYAHGPPPRGNRGGPPAEDPGFDTDAIPGEDELGWDVLPEAVVEGAKPEWTPDGTGGGGDGVLDWLDG